MFLSKSTNGFYYIVFNKPNGKRGSKSTKEKLKNNAIRRLREFQKQLEDERNREVIPIKLKQFTFNFLRSQEPYYTEKTINVYKSSFKYILNHFGDVEITELTTQLIESYLLKRIKETSVFAARKDLSNLSCAFNRAVRDGYLKQNPCKGIKRFKLPERQPLYYKKEDFKKLIEAIDSEDIRDLATVAINTGMRQGEQIALQWNQIDFNEGLIILDNRNFITKTKRVRSIPMNSKVREILQRRFNNKSDKHNFVFSYNGEPILQKFLTKHFKQFVIKAELNPKLNWHCLRHSAATHLLLNGCSIFVLSRILGHADIKTTCIYLNICRNDLQDAVSKLDGVI